MTAVDMECFYRIGEKLIFRSLSWLAKENELAKSQKPRLPHPAKPEGSAVKGLPALWPCGVTFGSSLKTEPEFRRSVWTIKRQQVRGRGKAA
jgi:hypothetical protein